MEFLVYAIAIVIIAYLVYRTAKSIPPPIPELKNKKLLYVDNGKAKAFCSKTYRIRAKPDYIYRIDPNTDAVVEYKDRQGRIYRSDEVQLIASAIAAREKYPNIKRGYIYTRGRKRKVYDLAAPTPTLLKSIEMELHYARQAVVGVETRSEGSPNKCRKCGVRYACNRSVA